MLLSVGMAMYQRVAAEGRYGYYVFVASRSLLRPDNCQ